MNPEQHIAIMLWPDYTALCERQGSGLAIKTQKGTVSTGAANGGRRQKAIKTWRHSYSVTVHRFTPFI